MEPYACPPLSDLADLDRRAVFQSHLDACVRCRTLLREIEAGPGEPLALDVKERFLSGSYARGTAVQPVNDVDVGSLVTASTEDQDEGLVCALVEFGEYDAVAVPLSHEIVFATNWDLILETALGY